MRQRFGHYKYTANIENSIKEYKLFFQKITKVNEYSYPYVYNSLQNKLWTEGC